MKEARESWFERLPAASLDQLVFIDEFGATTQMRRTHGRAPRGVRVVAKAPHGRWKVPGTIAAMSTRGIVCSATFDGATDAETFPAFVGQALASSLLHGQIVVMDDLSAHKRPEVRRLIEAAGAKLLYLPPYSPDYNPIEQAIAKVKSILRSAACREVEPLYDEIATALLKISPSDARAFMGHSGYLIR